MFIPKGKEAHDLVDEPGTTAVNTADGRAAGVLTQRRCNDSVHLPNVATMVPNGRTRGGEPPVTSPAGTIKYHGLSELKTMPAQTSPVTSSNGKPSKWYNHILRKIQRHKVEDASTKPNNLLGSKDSPPSAIGTSLPSANTSDFAATNIDNSKATPHHVYQPDSNPPNDGTMKGSSPNLCVVVGEAAGSSSSTPLSPHLAKCSEGVAMEDGVECCLTGRHVAYITPPGRRLGYPTDHFGRGSERSPLKPEPEPQLQPPHLTGIDGIQDGSMVYRDAKNETTRRIEQDQSTKPTSHVASDATDGINPMGQEMKQRGAGVGDHITSRARGEKLGEGREAAETDATSNNTCSRDTGGVIIERSVGESRVWDPAAAERKGISFTRGMRVLCLDIFISKIGGGEIRRWRPAEIAQVYTGQSDELVVGIEFSSYGDSTERIFLHLEDEWTRLAQALSLTEEEMSAGAPLEGKALKSSKKLFRPRVGPRKNKETSSPAGVAIVTGVDLSEGSRRQSLRGSEHGRSRWRRTGSVDVIRRRGKGVGFTGSVGIDEGQTEAAAVVAALSAAIVVAKETDLDDSVSFNDSDGLGGSGNERRENMGGEEGKGKARTRRALGTSLSLPDSLEARLTSAPHNVKATTAMTLFVPPSEPSRDLPGGSAAKANGVGSLKVARVRGDLVAATATATSSSHCRRLLLPDGPAVTLASGEEQGQWKERWKVQQSREQRGDVTGNGNASDALVLSSGVADRSERGSGQYTVWNTSRLPIAGDRFDCLDCFISSQTRKHAYKWREAEVIELRHYQKEGRLEIDVLVHYIRWSNKWDRWISFTRERDRFAPHMTWVLPSGAVGDQSDGFAGSSGDAGRDVRGKDSHGNGNGNGGSGSGNDNDRGVISAGRAVAQTATNHGVNVIFTPTYSGGVYSNNSYGGIYSGTMIYSAAAGYRCHTVSEGSAGGTPGAARGMPYRPLNEPGYSGINKKSEGGGVSFKPRLIRGGKADGIGDGGGGDGDLSSHSSGGRKSFSSSSRSRSMSGSHSGVPISGSGSGATEGAGKAAKCSPRTNSQESGSGGSDDEASADAVFREAMMRKGLSVVDVEPDGNCLFRSVSHQVLGDVERHYEVRASCVKHMLKHKARFGVFVAEDFGDYLFRISQPAVWGDDLEIRAMEELFDRPIEIYPSDAEDLKPMKIDFHASALDVETAPIKLSYHGQSHYNSVKDASISYPLKVRRSKNILRMREAQHARIPPLSSPAAGAASSFTGRAGGGSRPRGGGLGTEVGTRRSSREPLRSPPGTVSPGNNGGLKAGGRAKWMHVGGVVAKSEGVAKRGGVGGKEGGSGGGSVGAGNGPSHKFINMTRRTLFGGGGVGGKRGGA